MVFCILANWSTRITYVEGVFLHTSFQNKNEKVFTQVPLGLRELYPPWALLLLLATIYGTIQGALQWFSEMIKALMYIQWVRNSCDPCVRYKWIEGKLTVFIYGLTIVW